MMCISIIYPGFGILSTQVFVSIDLNTLISVVRVLHYKTDPYVMTGFTTALYILIR